MFLDNVKLGVRFLPEKPEGRFYVAKSRLCSHRLSFLCAKPCNGRNSELCITAEDRKRRIPIRYALL